MMIGIDIEEVERINKGLKNDNFIKRILLPSEIEYVDKFKDKASHITGFFCAKEAVMKALQDCNKISFLDIEIKHKQTGAPYAVLYGNAKTVFEKLNAKTIEISISQTQNYATAMCVIEKQ